MKIIRTAVVGLGRIGWSRHIPEVTKRPECFQLVAVVDLSRERLQEAKEKYGVPGYTDIAQMISGEQPELVIIASPTHLHREHACTALKLGCDVFLDKPMATTYPEALEIAQCAKENGRKIMVYQPRRTDAAPNQLMQLVATGRIGTLRSIRRSYGAYIRRADWQAFRKFGGGMLSNYGAHQIDAALYMTGEKVSRLFCCKDTVASAGDADDVVKVFFQMESGLTVDIDINQAAGVSAPDWILNGTCGGIVSQVSPEGKPVFKMRWFDPQALPPITASDSLAAANRSYNNDVPIPWQEETVPLNPDCAIDFYGKVYEYFGEDKAPFVPIEQTLYVMELIDRCHADAE